MPVFARPANRTRLALTLAHLLLFVLASPFHPACGPCPDETSSLLPRTILESFLPSSHQTRGLELEEPGAFVPPRSGPAVFAQDVRHPLPFLR